MKINLTICGVHEFPEHEETLWTHVVSIWDKRYLRSKTCRKTIKELAPNAKVHFSFFEDVDEADCPGAPTIHDVKRILAFTSQLTEKARVLVHCRAGVSRSTATAYAIFCQHSVPGTEFDNLLRVELLRDLVIPNRLIVQYADQILEREGAMLLHLHRG
jgi:predicted protein tyrosine phosphatase